MVLVYFQLPDGSVQPQFTGSDDRLDMKRLGRLLNSSVDNIALFGMRVECDDDDCRSALTLAELHFVADDIGCGEDGSYSNPFTLSVPGAIPGKFKATDIMYSPSAACLSCAATLEMGLFYDFRPLRALPLGIFVRAFGRVRDALAFEQQHISQQEWRFVFDLLQSMPLAFAGANGRADEGLRQDAFTICLRSYISTVLGPEFTAISNSAPGPDRAHHGRSCPDIKVYLQHGSQKLVMALVQVKPEIGFNGEPSIQNLLYYSHEVSAASHKSIYFTGYPMLLMELVGPHFRLGGAFFRDKAVYEPLTPYVALLGLHDPSHLLTLGRVSAAIRVALSDLKNVYVGAFARPRELRCEGALHWPYRLQELYPAARLEQLGKTPVYRVLQPGPQCLLVKFVQERYGEDAHAQWAVCGHAPSFQIEELPGSWKMISMTWLAREDGWIGLLELKKELPSRWDECKQAVTEALETLQSKTKMAHGDVRPPNIMYNVETGGVMFLDFDWAGPSGSVLYPPLMNPDIVWPAGVQGNTPILSRHDRDALELL